MKIPLPITVNTGEQEQVQKTIDDFFLETREDHIRMHGADPDKFQIRFFELSSNGVVTDNRITYVLYKQQILSAVLETRTEFNHVRYDFFRNV